MFNFLNPYLLYIKIAICAAALAGTAYVTHKWDVRAQAAVQLVAERKADSEYRVSVDMFRKRVEELDISRDAAVKQYQDKVVKLTTDNQDLNRKIKNASQKQPACAITAGTVWVWNDSTNRANGNSVPADSADTSGVLSSDGRITDATVQDLLTNHDAVVQKCGKWKQQLDSIIDWNKKQNENRNH